MEDTVGEEVGTSGELAAEALREAEEHTETEGLRVPVSVADTDTLPVGEMLLVPERDCVLVSVALLDCVAELVKELLKQAL